MSSHSSFTGFGGDVLAFFDALAANNNREWWADHKAEYQRDIAEPLQLLSAELADEFGEIKIFRPQRDVRFSQDKRPYQESASMVTNSPTLGTCYFRVHADGLLLGGGNFQPSPQQLDHWRRAVDDQALAAELDRILRQATSHGFELEEGNPVATAPRGWSKDHPRIDLIRRRSLTLGQTYPSQPWWYTAELATRVRAGWRALADWNSWLLQHLGPPAERPGRR